MQVGIRQHFFLGGSGESEPSGDGGGVFGVAGMDHPLDGAGVGSAEAGLDGRRVGAAGVRDAEDFVGMEEGGGVEGVEGPVSPMIEKSKAEGRGQAHATARLRHSTILADLSAKIVECA